ncbi:MAG: class I SAM-dependent methyltransferase [Pseudomonadota bacterium]
MKDASFLDNYKTTGNLGDRISLHQRFSTNETGWHNWVLSQLPDLEGQRVVELGCGRGDLWHSFNDTFDLLLTDRSTAMLASAKQKLATARRAGFQIVDLDDIDLAPDSADVVIANHCLYHAADPLRSLKGIRGVLRSGGIAVFATNGRRHMAELDGLLDEQNTRVDERFGLETGVEIARQVFAQVSVVRYPDSLHVTETRPLIDYIRSTPGPHDEDTLLNVEAYIAREIERYGAFFVGKDAGIVVVS